MKATLRAAAGLASRAPEAGTAATTLVDDATALLIMFMLALLVLSGETKERLMRCVRLVRENYA